MATDATFDNQLQALATATANFANGKDAAIKNTIITALGGSTQSGGGSTGTIVVDTSHWPAAMDVEDISNGKRIYTSGKPDFWIEVTLG